MNNTHNEIPSVGDLENNVYFNIQSSGLIENLQKDSAEYLNIALQSIIMHYPEDHQYLQIIDLLAAEFVDYSIVRMIIEVTDSLDEHLNLKGDQHWIEYFGDNIDPGLSDIEKATIYITQTILMIFEDGGTAHYIYTKYYLPFMIECLYAYKHSIDSDYEYALAQKANAEFEASELEQLDHIYFGEN